MRVLDGRAIVITGSEAFAHVVHDVFEPVSPGGRLILAEPRRR
jgi:hypothetical protein